jgi:hypothetical protein
MSVYREDSAFTFAGKGIKMAFNQVGQKMGLSENPLIVNMREYNACESRIQPVILHPLSVEITKVEPETGKITVNIRFNDVEITKNQRYSGNLLLKDYSWLENELIVNKHKILKINKSGTPNRHDQGEHGEYKDFITPTCFTVDSGAVMVIKGDVLVTEGSTFHLKKGSKLVIEKGGKLIFSANAYAGFENGAEIVSKGKIKGWKKVNKGINPLLNKAGGEFLTKLKL